MHECYSLESLGNITLNPYVIYFTTALLPPWISMEGVRLCPSAARAPVQAARVGDAYLSPLRAALHSPRSPLSPTSWPLPAVKPSAEFLTGVLVPLMPELWRAMLPAERS